MSLGLAIEMSKMGFKEMRTKAEVPSAVIFFLQLHLGLYLFLRMVHACSQKHVYSHTHTHTCSQKHVHYSHTHMLTHAHLETHTHSLIHSRTHTHSLTLTFTHTERESVRM